MTEHKQLTDTIPTAKAWQDGRRIYVICGYGSPLNGQLREIGAKWSQEHKALWVGSGKRQQVIDLVAAKVEAAAEITARKAAMRPLRIPYEAEEIRASVKAQGGIWDAREKVWYMPINVAMHTEIAVHRWWDERKAAKAAETATPPAEAAPAPTPEEIAASAGRIIAGEAYRTRNFLGRCTKAEALRQAGSIGEVLQSRKGPALIVAIGEPYWHEDAIDEGMMVVVTFVPVERTPAELAEIELISAANHMHNGDCSYAPIPDETPVVLHVQAAEPAAQGVCSAVHTSGRCIVHIAHYDEVDRWYEATPEQTARLVAAVETAEALGVEVKQMWISRPGQQG